MRSLTFLTTLAAMLLLASTAEAAPVKRLFQDVKLPTQAMMEHYTWTAPAAASATLLKSGQAATNGSTTTVTSFSAQPDFPRNIVLTTGGTTANIGAGTAVVSGTNIFGASISENFTITSAQNGATTGAKAFASVTSVVFPAATGTGATFSVGTGTKLGLNRCTANAGVYDWSVFNGAFESTRGTLASSASAVESNTFIPNGSMDGTKDAEIYYVQNFACFP